MHITFYNPDRWVSLIPTGEFSERIIWNTRNELLTLCAPINKIYRQIEGFISHDYISLVFLPMTC